MSGSKRRKKRKVSRQQSQSVSRQLKRIAAPTTKRTPPALRLAGQAAAQWDQLNFEKAMALFERALQTAPNNQSILLDLARAHLLRYNPEKAQALFDEALCRSKRSVPVLLRIAESYRKVPRHDLAEPFLREAAGQEDLSVEGLLAYAEVLERTHQLEDAEKLLARVDRIQPDHAPALLQRAKLLRRAGSDEESAAILLGLLRRSKLSYDVKWMAEYELAGLQDKAGQAKEAMGSWLRAKEVLRKEGELFRDQLNGINIEHERMVSELTSAHFQRWAGRGRSLGPPRKLCVLTGHPRSGTTLLEQILDSHPGAVSADESSIFGDDVATPIRRRAAAMLSLPEALEALSREELLAYRDCYVRFTESFLGEPLGDRVLIDKNPALTMQLPTLAAVFPEVKILFALRDPRDVVLSCFRQKFMMNSVSLSYLDLESTCAQYARIMKGWLQIREQMANPWLQVRYEDLVRNPAGEARRILAFLDLPWDEEVLQYHQHAKAKFVSSPTYEDVTKTIYQGAVGRWKNYQTFLEPHLDLLQPYVEAFGYD